MKRLVLLVGALVALAFPCAAFAQDVNTTADDGEGECTSEPGGCTLREALATSAPDAVIKLPAGTYELAQGPLLVDGERVVEGAGARDTIIDGADGGRVLQVFSGAPVVAGVTITNGDARIDPEAYAVGEGGGAYVAEEAALRLVESAVTYNIAETGGGIYSEGILTVERSTIAGNSAQGQEPLGGGLGIANGRAELTLSTVSGNWSAGSGAGLWTAAELLLAHVTVADNWSEQAGGLLQVLDQPSDLTTVSATLFADNGGGNCSASEAEPIETSGSLSDDGTPCGAEVVEDAMIAPLAPNGGPTDTHALGRGSPALDILGDGCGPFDQRGAPAPGDGGCDVGAYEARFDFTVDTAEDQDGPCTDEGEDCSLREAVRYAAPDAEIVVPGGDYVLERGALVVRRGMSIAGEGARETVLVGSGEDRVLEVADEAWATVSGVRITGGSTLDEAGGGVLVGPDAHLALRDSAVDGNEAAAGGGIFSNGFLEIQRSAIVRNEARGGGEGGGYGGGLFAGGDAYVTNSTISRNTGSIGGGIMGWGGYLRLRHTTVADNVTPPGVQSGHAIVFLQGFGEGGPVGDWQSRNTLIAGHAEGACGGMPPSYQTGSVTDDASCPGTVVGDALIGDLGFNGGATESHALLAGSPAIDAGDDHECPSDDQYGAERPIGLSCDAGALESDGVAAGRLKVVTAVVNDHGGTAGPGDFGVHVRAGGADVAGSPKPGDAGGSDYVLAPGTYAVAGAAARGYSVRVGGDCAGDGTVAVAAGDDDTCTVTFDDPAPAQPASGDPSPAVQQAEELPPPKAGKTVNALPGGGTVKVRLPGTASFVTLAEGQTLPVGTVVDARKGRVTLVAAGGQQATFYSGIFRIGQGKGAKPLTTLTLVEKLRCPRSGKASAAAKRKKKRRLWGDGSGRFRTKGQYSSATVRGTKWLVEDRCTSTLTRVAKGRVAVRDFAKRKTVLVKAGKTYVAKRRR